MPAGVHGPCGFDSRFRAERFGNSRQSLSPGGAGAFACLFLSRGECRRNYINLWVPGSNPGRAFAGTIAQLDRATDTFLYRLSPPSAGTRPTVGRVPIVIIHTHTRCRAHCGLATTSGFVTIPKELHRSPVQVQAAPRSRFSTRASRVPLSRRRKKGMGLAERASARNGRKAMNVGGLVGHGRDPGASIAASLWYCTIVHYNSNSDAR